MQVVKNSTIRRDMASSSRKMARMYSFIIPASTNRGSNLSMRATGLPLISSTAKKDNVIVINRIVFKALRKYLETVQPKDKNYLFASWKEG